MSEGVGGGGGSAWREWSAVTGGYQIQSGNTQQNKPRFSQPSQSQELRW